MVSVLPQFKQAFHALTRKNTKEFNNQYATVAKGIGMKRRKTRKNRKSRKASRRNRRF